MKRTLSFSLLMAMASACGTASTDPSNPNGSTGQASGPRTGAKIRYLGRVNENAAGGTMLAWPGTGVITAFKGTSLNVHMTVVDPTDINEIQVVMDGQPQDTAVTVDKSVTQFTVTADKDGTHDLQLIKRTEVADGKLLFSGFDSNASLVATPAVATRLIEFIGDSITAGYGTLGTGVQCPTVGSKVVNPDLEDAYKSYGSVTAQTLQADVSLVAISGRGVLINNDGSPGTNADEPTMPSVWTLLDPTDKTSTYDFKRPADVVVINLSTNDFSYYSNKSPATVPPQAAFVAAYTKLVQDVNSKYPHAQVVLALGPMLYDSSTVKQLSTARTYVQAVVTGLGSPSNLSTIEFPANSTDVGCDYHPNVTSQANMAKALVTQVQKVTGWQ